MKTPIPPSQNIGTRHYGVTAFLCLFLFCNYSFTQQLAFPTAEGFGKYATGGRGGAVIKVTNLNDSGPGSLRQALQYTTGPRTIIFEVGGIINLTSALSVLNGNVTVAGQTAPGGGILIKGSMLTIEASDVIIRHIRFRPGLNVPATEPDGLNITAWSNRLVENIIIDHCSISWSLDENLDIRSLGNGIARNISVQYCIISEANYGSLASGGTFNKTYYKNYLAHTSERNVTTNYPTPNTFDFEMINNLIYGVGRSTGLALGSKQTVINNHYKNSNQQAINPTIVDFTTVGQGTVSDTYSYIAGNLIPNGYEEYSPNVIPYIRTTPYLSSGIIPINASDVSGEIVPHVGASLPVRDAVDLRLINQYNTNTGSIAYSGTYPIISGGTAPADTDNDGMPNDWEIENGLNPNDALDRNIEQPDGYTNLEYYLNGMSLQVNTVTANAGVDVSICQGSTATLAATGGTTYLWNTGATTANIEVTPNSTTTYSVTAYDASGLNSDTDEVVVTVNSLPTANAGADVSTCFGTSVTLTATGGTSYIWSNGETSSTISVNPSNTSIYSVEVSQNGCSTTDEVQVTVNPLPSVSAGSDVTINLGQSATLTANGATAYSWSNGVNGASINVSPTSTTTFTVTGTNSNGCSSSDTITVNVETGEVITVNAGTDVSICEGNSTILTATGGTTYLWNNGENTASIEVSPNSTTTYSVTAYDTSGLNSDTDEVVVTVNSLPTANAGADVSICRGTSVTLTASGGSGYLWSNGADTSSITVSPSNTTTYTVEVTENGCSSTDDVRVSVNPLPSVDAGSDITINLGETITLTATGASFYSWSNGATGATVNVNPTVTTTYTVTGTNADGCSESDTVTVNVEIGESVTANAGADVSICEGNSTMLTATGGTTYLWNNGDTTASIEVSPNSTTTYSVTAYDTSGLNSDTDEVVVTVSPLPTADAGADVSICRGTSVTLSASGGDNYLWSNGATTTSITVNPNSTTIYTIEVTQNGCSSTDDVRVLVNPLPSVDAGSDVTINLGESTTLTATGGNTYAWSNGATGATVNVNPTVTTTYTVTGTNADGCSESDTVTVNVETGEVITVNAGEDVSICEGSSTTLTATGGTTYLWSNGETTASIEVSPNSTTTYSVTAYDTSGLNSDTDEVVVTVNSLPTANAGADVSTCVGTSVTLTATGGTSYLWSNGETSSTISVNPSNTSIYSVEVSQDGCSTTDEVQVTVYPLPSVSAGSDVTINLGQSATLTANGATTYSWSNGSNGSSVNVSPTSTTTFTVTGTNSNGCSSSDTITVNVEIGESVTANAGTDVSICEGSSTILTATGGTTYLWSNGEATASIEVSPNSTTTYSVTAYDTSGLNSDTDEVVVTVNSLPTANAGADVSICRGTSVTLTASGGSGYLWSNGASTSSITVSPNNTTTYTVEVTENGCSSTDDVRVTVNPLPSVNAGNNITIYLGESATLTASGASSYSWSTGATESSIDVSPIETTTYTVIGTSSNGCSTSDTVIVNVQVGDNVIAYAGEDVSICDGSVTTLSATGGSNYVWSTGETTESIEVSPNSTTTYSVTVYDVSGLNSDTDQVVVTVNPLPAASAGADISICRGTTVTLTASGGSSYLWSNGAITQNITVSPDNTTTYTVEVRQNGCSSTDDVRVSVNPMPSVNAGSDVTLNLGESTTLTATGANTYSWSNGENGSSINVNPTVTTTYTVTGTNDIGCSELDTVTVNVEIGENVTANAGEDVSICEGSSTTLTATGGTTYLWSNGEATASIEVSPNSTTTYSVTAYDTSGLNSDTDEVVVTVSPLPIADAGADVSICRGTTVTLTASGGSSYLWSNGAITQNITVSPNNTTTYTVEVRENGCSSTDDVRVSVNPLPSVDAGSDVTINLGESTILTATGANTYLWSNGENGSSINVNPTVTTNYTVIGTNASGCSKSDTVTVNVETGEDVTVNAGNDIFICQGSSTTLTATGGSTYLWSTGETSESIEVTPNSSITYSVTGYDASGLNSDTDEVVVTVNSLPIADAGADVSICRGTSVTLTANGGSSYLWNNGAITQSITVSPNNTTIYTVEVTQNGCSSTDDVRVTVNPLPSVSAGSDVTINLGESTTLTATGGNTYLWSNGEVGESINVSPSSTTSYTVIGTNANDCSKSDTVTVNVETGEDVTANAGNDISICQGSSTTLTATGGSSYLWNTGATTASIEVSPNSTTTYTVTAYDSSGLNSNRDDVLVTVNSAPSINISPNFTINYGQIVTLYAFGGTSYTWSTGETSTRITVIPSTTTTYSVVGTLNGCESSSSITITVMNEADYVSNAGINKSTCVGNGVTLSATGGDSYLWSTGERTQSINVNPNITTNYSVIVYTPTAQITDDVIVNVNPNPEVEITNGADVTILQGEFVTLSAIGANRYEWSNGATLANIAVNPSATTSYSVSGFIGDCSDLKDVTVNVIPPVVASAGNNQIICLNENITLTATGGDEFLWSTGDTTASISVSPTEDTEYSVIVYNDLDYDTSEVMVYVNDCTDSVAEDPESTDYFEFLVYPNPTSGDLNIKISGLTNLSNIIIYDIAGKMIYQENIPGDEVYQTFVKQLDLSAYPDGIYILKLVDDTHSIMKKIVLNR
ncbi:MAG: T9SS type A sorting domain-containing protein [Aquaticitalea sp.]